MRFAAALIGIPTLALALLSAAYALVPWVCSTGHHAVMHLLFATALLAGLALTAVARRGIALNETADEDAVTAQQSFLGYVAFFMGGFFTLVIAAFWLMQWLIAPCL